MDMEYYPFDPIWYSENGHIKGPWSTLMIVSGSLVLPTFALPLSPVFQSAVPLALSFQELHTFPKAANS